jgi:hypothetical protein
LNNQAVYTGEVRDAWFSATIPENTTFGIDNVYFPDNPVSLVGCTEQYQFCNGELCTPLGGNNMYRSKTLPNIDFNPLQVATFRMLVEFAGFMKISTLLQFLRNEFLLATQLVYGAMMVSTPLPANQWQLEMANLHNITLAGMQSHGLLHASPADMEIKPGSSIHDIVVPETTPENLRLCSNQKFRSTRYASFNLLGLVLVILLSFTIIVLNASLPMLVGWLQGRSEKGRHSRKAWVEDDVLQLQRIAFEGRGIGPWRGKDAQVPVLEECRSKFHRGGQYFDTGYAESTEQLKMGGYVGVREEVIL